ncbi:MAG: DUF6020 family protein [Coriobacteriales bacterium]|jgi:hypothetical protein|nr:DUF6020 family protein [Coriobacteriales bacterium]
MQNLKRLLSNDLEDRQELVLLGTLVLLPNLIVLFFLVWPGFLQADQVYSSIRLKIGEPDQWHSIVYTVLTFPFFDNAQGLGAYGLVYDVLFSLSCAWSLVRLRSLGILASQRACLVLTAVFALSPSFLFYTNVLYSTESAFMIALLPLTVFIIEIVHSKGAWLRSPGNWIRLAVFLFIALELRKNAVLLVFFILLILLLCYRARWRQILAATAVLALAFALTQGVARLAQVAPSPAQELVSIPAQQIARVYVDGGTIPDDIKARLDEIHPEEYWRENYLPSLADNEKRGIEPDAQFLADWIALGIQNPGSYANAYLDVTRSFWLWGDQPSHNEYMNAVDFTLSYVWTPEYVEQEFGGKAQLSEGFYETMGRRSTLRDAAVLGWDYLMTARPVPVITDVLKGVFFNIALPFYLCLAVLVVSIAKRRWSLLIIATPLWSTLLSFFVAAPVACYRYSAMLYLILPALVLLMAKTMREKKPQQSSKERETDALSP